MSKEELYTLTLSDIHKYKLLNEIFAIRDERFSKEQQDSMLCVNGYIGIDTLNDYVNLINQLQQKETIIKEVREYITSYESIETIQGLEDIEKNKDLDEKTLNEMLRRYMMVHDKLLEILDKKEVK